jgi:hypothetical protein
MQYMMLRDASWIWWLWKGYGTTTPVTDESYTDASNNAYCDASGAEIYVAQD